MKNIVSNIGLLLCAAALSLTSCMSDGEDTIVLESGNNTVIPSDNLADENPSIESPTTVIPNIQYIVETEGKDAIVRIDMTGIQEAGSYDWLRLVGTAQNGQNIWLSIDGKPKGISVYNSADDDEEQQVLATDLVFLVDNSGSMSEEADAIARDIISWAHQLEASNLDIRFGCVGYSEYGSINGAINLTDAESLSSYLNRSYGTGRSAGFYGSDADALSTSAETYGQTNGECGGMALRYADANMRFRAGANRIYVNFTDEPNQPNGRTAYSVTSFNNQETWSTNQGTVHTVYSSDTTFTERPYYGEKPWRISQYTGGTVLVAPSNFSGVTLESLPVTGAMTNSYIIRFTNISEFMDGKSHLVKITIQSEDGYTRAERRFYVNFGYPPKY